LLEERIIEIVGKCMNKMANNNRIPIQTREQELSCERATSQSTQQTNRKNNKSADRYTE
jgi:hypothetical protein